jgi:hypothetical protein
MDNMKKVSNNSSPDDEFSLAETDVSRITGLTADVLREHRKKSALRVGRVWLWSPNGVKEMEESISQKKAPPETPVAPTVMILTVARVRTPKVLHAVKDGEVYDPAQPRAVVLPQLFGQLFRPGMKVAAKQRVGATHVFDYAGHPDHPGNLRQIPRKVGFW